MKKFELMDDWYTSYSPRNSNSHAEGTWAEWVDLAKKIIAEELVRRKREEEEKNMALETGREEQI